MQEGSKKKTNIKNAGTFVCHRFFSVSGIIHTCVSHPKQWTHGKRVRIAATAGSGTQKFVRNDDRLSKRDILVFWMFVSILKWQLIWKINTTAVRRKLKSIHVQQRRRHSSIITSAYLSARSKYTIVLHKNLFKHLHWGRSTRTDAFDIVPTLSDTDTHAHRLARRAQLSSADDTA